MLAPGADPGAVEMRFEGAASERNELVVEAASNPAFPMVRMTTRNLGSLRTAGDASPSFACRICSTLSAMPDSLTTLPSASALSPPPPRRLPTPARRPGSTYVVSIFYNAYSDFIETFSPTRDPQLPSSPIQSLASFDRLPSGSLRR